MVRYLAADCSPSGLVKDLHTVDPDVLAGAWVRIKRGMHALRDLLVNNLGIASSSEIPSLLAAIPLVAWLGRQPHRSALSNTDAVAVLYWFLLAQVLRHCASSIDSVLQDDEAALRGEVAATTMDQTSLRLLYSRLSTGGSGLAVTPALLEGQVGPVPSCY